MILSVSSPRAAASESELERGFDDGENDDDDDDDVAVVVSEKDKDECEFFFECANRIAEARAVPGEKGEPFFFEPRCWLCLVSLLLGSSPVEEEVGDTDGDFLLRSPMPGGQ